jgi:sugar lactone lactonase YvrE
MPRVRRSLFVAALAASALWNPLVARAQLTVVESGFTYIPLSTDLAKQDEIGPGGAGGDTCLYYGSSDGLKRRCNWFDDGTICDPDLTFPSGIAFSTGGSFGAYMYVADFGLDEIRRSVGCSVASPFAVISSPGSIAFPPSGSAYGDYLYACQAYNGPIYRVSSAGVVTAWKTLASLYLRFGPGGTWGSELYSTDFATPGSGRIVRVSSTGTVTPVATSFGIAEGFDWAFDGDLFAADAGTGQVLRVKLNGSKTVFATLPGAADVAYRSGEDALYVVSNMGGLYRIARGSTSGVGDRPRIALPLSVAPNPSSGSCTFRFSLAASGLARTQVLDATGRIVRRLPEAWCPAGQQSLIWDGRDDAGQRVRPGTYFARLTAAGETRSTALSIVR